MLIFRNCLLIIGLLFVWHLVVWIFHFQSFILPEPYLVLQSLVHNLHLIAEQSVPTIIETLLGLLFGTLLGCFSSLCLIYFKPLRFWFLPVLLISQALPTFAIAPLFIIWFGYGMASKIAVTIVMLFFPIASTFYDGLSQTPPEYLNLAKTMNASRLQILLKIQIPAALPALAAGLRIAATIAPIGAIIGEWVGSSQGLGFLLLNANARMETSLMFAVLVVIVVLTLCLYFTMDKALKKLITW